MYTISIRAWLQSYFKKKDILGKKTFLIRKCYLKAHDANMLQ